MSPAKTMENMLRKLLGEMDYVQSQGAGYYTCSPFARRFNKLRAQAHKLYAEANPLIDTFEELDETDPKDPGDKSKRLLLIRIEITQLISFLETMQEEGDA